MGRPPSSVNGPEQGKMDWFGGGRLEWERALEDRLVLRILATSAAVIVFTVIMFWPSKDGGVLARKFKTILFVSCDAFDDTSGAPDPPLSQKGQASAVALSSRLKEQGGRPELVLCSPLQRALQVCVHACQVRLRSPNSSQTGSSRMLYR